MIGIAQTISRTSSRAPPRLSAKINLIPYNTVEGLEWSRPSRAAGKISIDPAEARCGRNLAPRERPRHRRRLRPVTTTDEPRRAHVIVLTSSFLLFEKRGQRASFKSGFQADAD